MCVCWDDGDFTSRWFPTQATKMIFVFCVFGFVGHRAGCSKIPESIIFFLFIIFSPPDSFGGYHLLQGGPRTDRYKWTSNRYKWPKK